MRLVEVQPGKEARVLDAIHPLGCARDDLVGASPGAVPAAVRHRLDIVVAGESPCEAARMVEHARGHKSPGVEPGPCSTDASDMSPVGPEGTSVLANAMAWGRVP